MTQKTSLKTKAKTTYKINQLYHDSNKIDHSQWVLLSDAEAEIQQLKKEKDELSQRLFDTQTDVLEADKEIQQLKKEHSNIYEQDLRIFAIQHQKIVELKRQIETAKQIIEPKIKEQSKIKVPIDYKIILDSREIAQLQRYVFGEKTQT